MKKSAIILITGANGLLGSYIIRYLVQNGYQNIIGLVRKNANKGLIDLSELEHVRWIEGDIMDMSQMDDIISNVNYVIHTAAEVHFDTRNKSKLYQVNVEGTVNIVNSSLNHNIEKLIYISSTAALGRIYNHQKIDEDTMWEDTEFNTHYAVSKHQGEIEVWRAHQEGLNVCILNPSLIITPGYFDRSSAGIFSRIYKKMKYYPTGTNGVVGVRDAAKLAILLLESDKSNVRLIACAGNLSYKKLFELVANNFGKHKPSLALTNFKRKIIIVLSKILSIGGFNLDISKVSLINSSMHFYYNNERSKEMFTFEYRNIENSIFDSCNAFKTAKEKNLDYCTLPI